MKKLRSLLEILLSMMKVGFFTFGGGYAMIHLLDDEFVGKRHYMEPDEFTDLVAIAESTPGPIAINCATYIGYKREKLPGAIVATLGMCLPSFAVIYLISLFFDAFLSVSFVASAFRGIQMAVVFLILAAGFKMLKKMKKTPLAIIGAALTFSCMMILNLLAVDFSSIFYILIFASVGIFIYALSYIKKKGDGKK